MKCTVPGVNCKILGRAIHALGKISEEMYVEPREKSLSFRAVSPSSSAFCDFTFKDIYFSHYSFGDLEEEDTLKCKISMRSALTVFKSMPVIEKSVENCHIRLEPNADHLIFILKFKNSIVKTFFLPIIDCEQLSGPLTKDNLPNKLSAKSRVLTDVVQNFQQNLVEITLEVTPQKLLMRNYVDNNSTVANSTRTQLAVTIGEFDEYKINMDSQITFCLKEFKAILGFAEVVSLPVNIYFETMGKPVFFDLTHSSFEASLVLSTLNPDSDEISTSMRNAELKQSMRKRVAPKKTPRQAAKQTRKKPTNKSTVSRKSTSSNTSILPNRTDPNISRVNNNEPDISATQREIGRHSNAISVDRHTSISQSRSPIVSSLDSMSNRTGEPSIFSPAWKERNSRNSDTGNSNEAMDVDEVPGSPPAAKKAKMIFRRCFEATFDPSKLSGQNSILAEDSDEEK